jgi:hypothetical protein
VAEELLEQEMIMGQCVEQLESCERSHAALCADLKDALLEQVLACLCNRPCASVAILFVLLHMHP